MNAIWVSAQRAMFGEGRSGGSELETTVQATWPVSPGLTIVVLLAGAAIVATIYWHERASVTRQARMLLAAMRTTLMLTVLLMLYGWTIQRHRIDRPDVVLILDDSSSMGIVEGSFDLAAGAELQRRLSKLDLDKPMRINLAKVLLLERDGELLKALQKRYRLRVFSAGETARCVSDDAADAGQSLKSMTAEQPASRLGDCLRDVLQAQRGRPTAAVVMFTDGLTTAGKSLTEAAQYARRRSVPLFLVGMGRDRPEPDLKLADLLADDRAFVGDTVHFDFKLQADGFSGGATVRLKRADESKVLAEEKVTLDQAGTSRPLRLSCHADQPGEFEYVVEVVPCEGEASLANNRLMHRIVVRDEIVRVLLVQGYPSYEFRFLKQMLLRELNRNESIEGKASGFRTVLQEADLEYDESDKTAERTFPASRDDLFQYDVLIFGDVNLSLLSSTILNNIYEFVTVRGGGVIFIAGPRYFPLAYYDTPIAHLLPMNLDAVRPSDRNAAVVDSFRPRLTALGQASPMMQLADSEAANERVWKEEITPLRWFLDVDSLRPGVRVLAEHPARRSMVGTPLPFITLQFLGAGKVVFHATDETYRWRFRVGDVYFARYWVQMIRYLARSKLLSGSRGIEVATDRERYDRNDDVSIRVRFFDDRLAPPSDDGVVVIVEADGGQRRQIVLHRHQSERGLFEGSAGSLPEDRYRASIVTPALDDASAIARFAVATLSPELARTQMDGEALREAAKASLGKYYTTATASKLLLDLPPGRAVRIESLPPRPLWNAPIAAGVFVALIAVEWLVRKRVGLL